ncbi:MAG: flavin reductase [Betaproteobacteria bacterium]|nr:flavin reductase [Betaproteobacteria bacterium]
MGPQRAGDTAVSTPERPSPTALTAPPAPQQELKSLRSALGRFATGVTVVTCLDSAGERRGLTVNSFTSVSLEPPLVLWSLRRVSPSLEAFERASHFAVNVLSQEQVEVSRHFASQDPDKFAVGHWSEGLGGAPVLSAAAAVFECESYQVMDAGDHRLLLGQVMNYRDQGVAALVFQGGRYRLLGEVL